MKKVLFVAVAALFLALTPVMADTPTYFNKGALVAQVGTGFGFWGLGVEGGVDNSLGQWTPTPVLPLDLGWGARAAINFGYGFGFGGGAFVTVHYSLKNLKTGNAFVDKLEFDDGIGVQVFIIPGFDTQIGFGDYSDFVYHFDDRLGIDLGYTTFTGATIGITYKL